MSDITLIKSIIYILLILLIILYIFDFIDIFTQPMGCFW